MNTMLLPTAARAVRTPAWRIAIENRDVSIEISPMVLRVSYVDHLHGSSDEVGIVLQNRGGRWTDTWAPAKGDRLDVMIGYAGEPLIPCGQFQVDELEASGPPDEVTIKALAAGITPAVRTKRSVAYESQTLRDIAAAVAARNGMQVDGVIADVRLGRVTQHREQDLAFLARLAREYGHVFSVRGDRLVFHELAALERVPSVWEIRRQDCESYRFKSKTQGIYRGAASRYADPSTRALVSGSATADGVQKGDILVVSGRTESDALAARKADAALRFANREATTGELRMSGHPRLMAGVRVDCSGFGALCDGRYLVETSRHDLDKQSGYRVAVEVKGVA